jgi:hypothetical protein
MKIIYEGSKLHVSTPSALADNTSLYFSRLLHVHGREGDAAAVEVQQVNEEDGRWKIDGKSNEFDVTSEWIEMTGDCTYWQVNFDISYLGHVPKDLSLRFQGEVKGPYSDVLNLPEDKKA